MPTDDPPDTPALANTVGANLTATDVSQDERRPRPGRLGGAMTETADILRAGGLTTKYRAVLRRAIALLEKASHDETHKLVDTLNKLGWSLIGEDNAQARRLLERARKLTDTLPARGVRAVRSRNVYDSLGYLELAEKHYATAMTLCARVHAEIAKDSPNDVAASLLCMARAERGQSHNAKAIAYLERALKPPGPDRLLTNAKARCELAELLAATPATKARAVTEANRARDDLAKLGPFGASQHTAVDRWLHKHRGR